MGNQSTWTRHASQYIWYIKLSRVYYCVQQRFFERTAVTHWQRAASPTGHQLSLRSMRESTTEVHLRQTTIPYMKGTLQIAILAVAMYELAGK